MLDASQEWHCEANVVSAIVAYLRHSGWAIVSVADTEKRGHGADIHAQREGKSLIVEVKGYPSTVYARGEKKGQPKPTPPAVQARHWYSHVLLDLILRQSEHESAALVIGLPDFPVYRQLIKKTERALRRLGIGVFLVLESGEVQVLSFAT